MDKLASLGTRIHLLMGATMRAYEPLLTANIDAIRSTKCETLSYGPDSRHLVDLYTPASPTINGKRHDS